MISNIKKILLLSLLGFTQLTQTMGLPLSKSAQTGVSTLESQAKKVVTTPVAPVVQEISKELAPIKFTVENNTGKEIYATYPWGHEPIDATAKTRGPAEQKPVKVEFDVKPQPQKTWISHHGYRIGLKPNDIRIPVSFFYTNPKDGEFPLLTLEVYVNLDSKTWDFSANNFSRRNILQMQVPSKNLDESVSINIVIPKEIEKAEVMPTVVTK